MPVIASVLVALTTPFATLVIVRNCVGLPTEKTFACPPSVDPEPIATLLAPVTLAY